MRSQEVQIIDPPLKLLSAGQQVCVCVGREGVCVWGEGGCVGGGGGGGGGGGKVWVSG